MYPINRLNAITEIELLVLEHFNKSVVSKCSIEIYGEILEMVVSILNNPVEGNIADRTDNEFRFREIPFELRLSLFDYVADLASRVRSAAIQLRIPIYAKYKVELSKRPGLVTTDRIILDFPATHLYMAEQEKEQDSPDSIMNPTIEDFEAHDQHRH